MTYRADDYLRGYISGNADGVVPKGPCPHCGKNLERAGTAVVRKVKPKDIGVCLMCSEVYVFVVDPSDSSSVVRSKAEPSDLVELTPGQREDIERIRWMVREAKAYRVT